MPEYFDETEVLFFKGQLIIKEVILKPASKPEEVDNKKANPMKAGFPEMY
jgi:hypothetical protein